MLDDERHEKYETERDFMSVWHVCTSVGLTQRRRLRLCFLLHVNCAVIDLDIATNYITWNTMRLFAVLLGLLIRHLITKKQDRQKHDK